MVGAPDPIRHTIVKAFIIVSREYDYVHTDAGRAQQLTKELQDFVKKTTGPYKYPRAIEFVRDLPKTVSGKIRRLELREREWEGHQIGPRKLSKL